MKKNHIVLIAILAVTLAVLLVVCIFVVGKGNDTPTPTEPQITQPTTEPTPAPTAPPTEPPITKVGTATVSSVGDMLMHMPVINTGYDEETRTYDLHAIFDYISDYTTSADLMVGNLETTLAGLDNGYKYSGYPQFNCPDSVVDAMKSAGFDVVLTANNHSYDTRTVGLNRTLQVIKDRQLQYLGTKLDAEEKDYVIADCNGIQIGLLCYTYDTGTVDPETIALNGITLTKEDSKLVNSFDYNELDVFYADVQENLAAMEKDGAEAVMLYIHWGEEYQLQANSSQKAIAQRLCDLGVDVIVGGHPHVVQPVELLTNENDETKKTLCLYSTGNAVSNITRHDKNRPINCEDGMLFNVTFAKYSDGTVILESADIMPTWVDQMDESDWTDQFIVMPLDRDTADWQAALGINDATLQECKNSYDRTMGIVGAGLEEANAYYAQNQKAVEAEIGVK